MREGIEGREPMTDEERRHVEEELIPDAERAKSIEELQYPVEEHLRYMRMSVDDLKGKLHKFERLVVLWVLMWVIVVGLIIYELVR